MEPHNVETSSSAQPVAGSASPAWRVLIADEEAGVRAQLAGLIHSGDCKTLEAANGAAALELLRLGAVDVAFINAQLPGLSGSELRQAAQQLARPVPIIPFTTTKSLAAEVQSMTSDATEGVPTLPVDRDALIQAIQRALRGRPPTAAAEARREQQAHLYQSNKLEALGRLATSLAHEFNNLLTIIMGYSEMVLSSLRDDDPNRPSLEQIHKAGERAAALARQLLAFGRQQSLPPMLLDLSAVVADLNDMLPRLLGANVELVTRLDPAPCPVRADPSQLEQVLVNLVVNARDAMPAGGKLAIETANTVLDEAAARELGARQSGPYVVLAVTDTGCGMDAETQGRAFEPFFTTKVQGKASGLGLSIVRDIVQQSGGAIQVKSELSRGTTFIIYLPAVAAAGEQAVPAAAAATPPPPAGQTVLVTEANEGIRLLLCNILERHGYTVLEARQADEAIRIGEQHAGTIHLLVTEVELPQMTGRQLADQFRTLRPDIRVLFMSGLTTTAIAQQGVLDPNLPFLQKPFTPEALAAKVKQLLEAPLTSDT